MERHDACYRQYVQILREELRPATGCTEPIAIAYAAAKARSVLGALPDRVLVEVSGNIIKNVKSVVVPHTGGLRGIPAAATAGIVAGDAEAQLEVLSAMTEAQSAAISPFLKVVPVEVRHADTPYIFDIQVTVFHGPDSAQVRLVGHHTNVVSVRRDGQVLLEREISEGSGSLTDRSCLTVEGIVAFADCLSTEDVEEVLEQQIRCNMAIAEEGLRHDYGANIGKTLLRGHEEDLSYRMRAYAAAASDARMNGCEMPVVINSGSGNQGITSSVPVIVCARATGRSHEELLRALAVANLVTIHLKTGIGRLSAYCGAVSAGCGAAAGLAYLQGGDYDTVAHTVVNTVAMDSGIICDGAKASCAAKIAAAVDAGLDELCLTDHVDTVYWGPEQKPRWDFDWDAVRRQFRQAQEQWGHRITLRLGAELGEAAMSFQRAEHLMQNAPPLDFVIGSVHMAGKKFHHKDLYYIEKADEAYYDSIIDSYLEDVLALARWGKFQVLGHLTLPLRYINENYGEHMTFAHHMDQVEEIFRTIIPKGLGIECNTNRGNEPLPGADILRLYRRLGGEIITLGSDAHRPEDVGCFIRQRQELLRECGFRYFTTFTGGKPEFKEL